MWPLYLESLGATPADIGAVFGGGNVFAALCFIPVGFAADRFGRWPLLVTTWSASTVGAAAFLPLDDWHGAFVGSALYWAGSAAVPVLIAQIAATEPRTVLGRALGIVFGAYFVGNIVGSPLSGLIAAQAGLRGPIIVALAAFVLSTGCVLFVRRTRKGTEIVGHGRLPRSFWVLLVMVPFAALVAVVATPLLPVYLREIARLPLERIGFYVSFVALGAALFAAGCGRLADRTGPGPALVVGALLLTAGAVLCAVATASAVVLALGTVLLGASQAANPVLAAALERVVPPARASLAYASFQLAYAVGFGGGGALAGQLYEVDPALPLLVTVALALPVAVTIAAITTRVVRGTRSDQRPV